MQYQIISNIQIINNHNTNINNQDNPETVRRFLEELIDSERNVFCLIDGVMSVMDFQFRKTCFCPNDGVEVVWLDVDDLMQCDILIRGEDVNEYLQDDGAEYGLEFLVQDTDLDGYPVLLVKYERRDLEKPSCTSFGMVTPSESFDVFKLRLPHNVVNQLMRDLQDDIDVVVERCNTNRTGYGYGTHHVFEHDNIDFTVVAVGMRRNGELYFEINKEQDTSRFIVDVKYTINEDKFGNRLDEDGEIIVEDDE